MTKKRFRHNGSIIFDNLTPLNTLEVVELLNELNNEKKELKEIFKTMIRQLDIEIDSEETIYRGTFVFRGESFMVLEKLCK